MTTEISSYKDFFRIAFGNEPFAYQEQLAKETDDFPSLLNVPTGAGKTNAILGAWLWRRFRIPETVGRRLIYCLPMRTLVEQTRAVAKAAIKKLEAEETEFKNRFSVHTLYGGDVSDDWDIFPEQEQIIIGTQDLLLSRALNRGYAMNRFRWAFHFGLFNNDCLWIFDEIQLFGDGLATSTQLQAFRENQEKFGTFGNAKSIWMSATLDRAWLKTIDFAPQVDGLKSLSLSETDKQSEILNTRLEAVKDLRKAEIECRLPKGLAEFVKAGHERGTQTLVVVNTVQRAQEVFDALEKLYAEDAKKAKKSATSTLFESSAEKPEIKLIHSRFRPSEREEWREIFDDRNADRIIVATQVVEAGVDISSKLLVTDLAPFSSLVQRFGRCNRNGEHARAEVFWIDLPLKEKDKDKDSAKQEFEKIDDRKLADSTKPYEIESLKKAKAILESLDSVSLSVLETLDYTEPFVPNHVLRQRDLIDLFDTTADLSGFDLDVSRFVRGGEERDVSIYWREEAEKQVNAVREAIKLGSSQKKIHNLIKLVSADRNELCSVRLSQAKDFLKGKSAWTFDALQSDYIKADTNKLRAGMIILLDVKEGGYDCEKGWLGRHSKSAKDYVKSALIEVGTKDTVDEAYDDDELTFEVKKVEEVNRNSEEKKKVEFFSYKQTLQAHSREVKQAAEDILKELNLPELDEFSKEIVSAAHHHDLGKAHEVFQKTLHGDEENFKEVLAKSKKGGKHGRKKFRHELASALALLKAGRDDLEVYLAAAHHGKVRLSIRALPDETKPFEIDENGERKLIDKKYARGIWEGDQLPETDLGDGVKFPPQTLNLDALSLGRNADGEPSWLERMINLRAKLGVFRLAYLEAIVRAADVQASAYPKEVLPETSASADEQNSVEANEND